MQNLNKISGATPGQTSSILPSKICPKRLIFNPITYMAEYFYAGSNTN